MSEPFHIAIDGPVAAGKGTVSKLLADRLGFLYVDTGAMYRMTALLAKNNNIDFSDEAILVGLVEAARMEMRPPTEEEKDGRLSTVILNGEDVSWAIRTEEMSHGSSQVAMLAEVRKALVVKQKEIAMAQNVVMEGRDITTVVLPDAQLKIYLTADTIVRAERRHQQFLTRGEDVALETVIAQLEARDHDDMSRKADPLKIAPGAWVLDTSELSIEEVVQKIVDKVAASRDK